MSVQGADNDEQKRQWSIRNHLGGEVGLVETTGNPIAHFASETKTIYQKLIDIGYSAVEVKQSDCSKA